MSIKASQCPVLLSVRDHENIVKQSIQPIEAIETPIDLLATIVDAFGLVFPGGKPSEERIQVELRHRNQVDLRESVIGLRRIMERKQQEYANPTSFEDMLKVTISFHSINVDSSPIDFEFISPVTPQGLQFQEEVFGILNARDRYTLNVCPEMLTTMLWSRPSAGHHQSMLQSTQNKLSVQQEKNRDMNAEVQELKKTQFTQREWAWINHGETNVYAERLEEEVDRLREVLEETTDRFEEKIDELTEENKRLEGYEVQAAELDDALRKLIAEARGGSIDVADLSAIRKTFL